MKKQEAIELLSEMRSGYNCFDESERQFYEALSVAIEALTELDNNSTELNNKNVELVRKEDVIKMIQETNISSGMTKARLLIKAQDLPSAQPEITRCKDCEHSEKWYGDKSRCFLWNKDGIDVFDDGYCNYGRKENG